MVVKGVCILVCVKCVGLRVCALRMCVDIDLCVCVKGVCVLRVCVYVSRAYVCYVCVCVGIHLCVCIC